jgi:eukaryotic-like serine/threonine-protein kinase
VRPGTRFGAYEIVGPLGAGGMGEVYRARDPRLQRDVALKLLPASVATDPERLARFSREAQLLAAINHPNIGTIHGLEKVDSVQSLVLELVEGPTLAERIAEGSLPLDETVAIARQMADALEYAHEQGIIHRDLKPANIKVRPDGTVKVLDFGLGKALGAPGSQADPAQDPAQSPTLTHAATAQGMILGTAAYMAPEQARGRMVDRRVDIWSFGVVVFEMLAGSRPFGGETISESMAAIIKDEPAWNALPASTPEPIRELLRRMLEKDPKRRLRDIGDARLVLEDLQRGVDPRGNASAPPARVRWTTMLPWAIALVSLVAAIVIAQRRQPASTPSSATVNPTTAPTPGQAAPAGATELPALKYSLPIPNLQLERTVLPALSPDGRRIVYGTKGQLWLRELDKLEPRLLAGTDGAQFPFWSPDGQQVAYLAGNALWRVPLDGSRPVRIAAANFGKGGRTPGGVWQRSGTIVFAPARNGTSFLSVSADGGELRESITRDPKVESDFHRPSLLPDGESILFIVDHADGGADAIDVFSRGVRKNLLRLPGETLDSPVYSPTGHILYQRETTTPGIWALPFSLETLEPTGNPFLVVPQGSWPAIGANGLLVYAESELTGLEELVWVNLDTEKVTLALGQKFPEISFPRLSPDGTRIAAVARVGESGYALIVADLKRQTHVVVSDRVTRNSRPAWRDDRTVVYSVQSSGGEQIASRRADASQPAVEWFLGGQANINAGRLLFVREESSNGRGVFQVALPPGEIAPRDAAAIQQTPINENEPALSPDGRLLAYAQGDYGQAELMLRTYPEATGQWQVSLEGGGRPLWSRASDRLYFRDTAGQVFVVDVTRKPVVRLSRPRPVFRPPLVIARAGFDLSRDGKQLLMMREVQADPPGGPSLAVVQNWLADFRRR